MPNNINKVVFGNDTLMDLTNDTVSADNLLEGETAHDRSGSSVVGTAKQGHVIKDQDGTSMTQRNNLKFEGGFDVSDDSQNNTTKIQKDIPITWDKWNQLTDQEAEGKDYYITDEPYVNGKINTEVFTKLWENPNPTSAFAAQTITLASDDYDFLFVSYKVATTAGFMSVIAPKGGSIYLDSASWQSGYTAATYDRTLNRVNDTQYTATDAELNGQVNNGLIIPVAIYGFKKNIEFDLTTVVANVSTDAKKCVYDNTDSGLEATNVQDAIDEIAGWGSTSSAISLLNVNDTYTAPTNGVFSGYIRCASGQSVGYIQIGSSLSQIGAIKALQYVNGSGGYTMITLPMQKGETITIIAKNNLDGGFYGWFTSFSN